MKRIEELEDIHMYSLNIEKKTTQITFGFHRDKKLRLSLVKLCRNME